MKRWRNFATLVVLVAMGVVVLLGLVPGAAFAGPDEAPPPPGDDVRPQAVPGTWNTGFQVQNLGTSDATVRVYYYDATGTLVYTQGPVTIGVGEAATFYQPDIPDADLPAGQYSVIVESDQPVAAVVNQTNYDYSIADSYNGLDQGATEVNLPLVFSGHSDWYSTIVVQNADSDSASVTLHFYTPGNSTAVYTKGPDAIPAAAALSYDLSEGEYITALGGSWYGSVVVSSDRNVVAVVNEFKVTDGTRIMSTLSGFVESGTKFMAPLVFKNYSPNDTSGWTSGIQVQNLGATDATVRMTYTAGGVPYVKEKTVAANSSGTFYMPDYGDIPDGSVGSAVVECTTGQDIAVLVNTTKYAAGVAVGYNAFLDGTGTTKISCPLVFKNYNPDWITGVQVQNMGATDATVRMTYTDTPSGVSYVKEKTVAANSSGTFYMPDYGDIPDGYGSAVVECTTGQDIVAIVNTTKYSAPFALNYRGLNY